MSKHRPATWRALVVLAALATSLFATTLPASAAPEPVRREIAWTTPVAPSPSGISWTSTPNGISWTSTPAGISWTSTPSGISWTATPLGISWT